MGKGFSVTGEMLNDVSQVQSNIQNSKNYKLSFIPIEKIKPSEKNHYSLDNIQELAECIQSDGLNQPLVVRKSKIETENDTYELIYGHRRRLAILYNIEHGDNRYKEVPCYIKDISDDVDMELSLINGNASARVLSDVEKANDIKRQKELYKIKRDRGDKISGRIRDLIAANMNISPSSVARLETINNGLIPEFKKQFDNNKISTSTAAELAKKSKQEQTDIYNNTEKVKKPLKLSDVKKKEKLKADAASDHQPAGDKAHTENNESSVPIIEKNSDEQHSEVVEPSAAESEVLDYAITSVDSAKSFLSKIDDWLKDGATINLTVKLK